MNVVRGRAEARFLPSRFHFALFRLIAWICYRAATPREQHGLLLIIDRDQTAWEHYLVALWYFATMSCFLAELLSIPLVVAPLAVLVLIHVLLFTTGLLLRHRDNVRLQSLLFMAVPIVAAVYYAFAETWVRFAAWQCLALVALNAFCAMILFIMREAVLSAA